MEHLDEKLANAYLDGELTDEELAGVEEHLKTCPACRQWLGIYRGFLGSLTGEAPQWDVEAFTAGVRERIEPAGGKQHWAAAPWWRGAAVAAAVLVVLAGGGELYRARLAYHKVLDQEVAMAVKEHQALRLGELSGLVWEGRE